MKNLFLLATVTILGLAALTGLQAQQTPTPSTSTPPPAGQAVAPPPGRPFARPPFDPRMRGMNRYRGLAAALRRAKIDLEKSTEDYNGHRQSAIEAIDKAVTELEAVEAAMDAERAAKAAAAKAAAAGAQQPNGQPPAQTPPPSSTPAPNQ